jgi:hypothetical protein
MILLALESRWSLVCRLWAVAALFLVLAETAWAGQPRIDTPAGLGEIHLPDDVLIPVRGGWAYRFPVTVDASSPILGVSIDGESLTVPFKAHVKLERAIRLQPGVNRIVVKAFTDEQVAERVFTLHVDGLVADDLDARLETEQQEILILRPLDHAAEVVRPEEMLEVPGGPVVLRDARFARVTRGGLMYEFIVEVSAFQPIREVRINGQVVEHPNSTWTRIARPLFLDPGLNAIEVEAVTDSQKAKRSFPIRLAAVRIPQTPVALPDTRGAPVDARTPSDATIPSQ